MSRLIDIDHATETIWISFPYDPGLVECVKTLPRRRWDQSSRRWGVPAEDAVEAIALLEEHKFSLTPRMRAFWRENGLADELRALREGRGDGLTVSELNREVSRVLRTQMPDEIWVTGTLSGFDPERNRSGHAYFELVEMRDERVTARVSAVLFDRELARIRRKIEAESAGRIELRDGLEVRLRARVDFYEQQGKFQLRVSDFDVAYATGKIEQARDKILRTLESEGIRHKNLAIEMPLAPLRIGLITSAESDAQGDFIDELQRSGWAFEVVLHDAYVQGKRAERAIVEALGYFAERAERFDVIAIIRGGGARSDLSAFDSLEIGRAICNLDIKVICGVGHHLDRSVLDFVCESTKTPTAAAGHLVSRVDEVARRLIDCRLALATAASTRLEHSRDRLDRESRRVVSGAQMGMQASRVALVSATRGLERESRRICAESERRCERVSKGLETGVHRRFERRRRDLWAISERLDEGRIGLGIARRSQRVDTAEDRLRRVVDHKMTRDVRALDAAEREVRLADPRRVLERGFSIVRAGDKVVSIRELSADQKVELQFHDGRASATIDDVQCEDEDE